VAVREMAADSTRQIVANESFSRQALSSLQRGLEQFRGGDGPSVDFSLEYFIWLDAIQRLFTDDGNGQGHMPRTTVKELTRWRDSLKSGHEGDFAKLDRRGTTQRVEKFFELARASSTQTPWEFNHGASPVRAEMEQLMREDPFVEVSGRPLVEVIGLAWRARTSLDATITVLALLRYATDHGRYPDSLAGLVDAGYIGFVPRDAYSDGVLVYRTVEAGFVLYSLGADFDDDGGQPSHWGLGKQGGDQVFWPVETVEDRPPSDAQAGGG
jgi:hypothetical protein